MGQRNRAHRTKQAKGNDESFSLRRLGRIKLVCRLRPVAFFHHAGHTRRTHDNR